jgi:hypothetical protein
MLNGSQSGADGKDTKHGIPNGCMVALTLLCGSSMYNLAEASDGTKCLVLESNYSATPGYLLVSADEAGMNFLIGDNASTTSGGRDHNGNSHANVAWSNGAWHVTEVTFSKTPNVYHYADGKQFDGKYNNKTKTFGSTVEQPPTRIDCAKIIPNSVKEYENFHIKDKITTEVVSSWTDAFSTKTKFINTAIDTINTDIQVDRSKIDSFDSICSTFRSRAHEAHSNTAANVR